MRKFISLFGLMLYSHFCAGQTTVLMSFSVTQTLYGVSVKWETLKDFSLDTFKIEVSKDGQTFTDIGMMEAKGDGNKYQLTYDKKQFGIVYYQIGVLSAKGIYTTLKTISVVNTPSVTQVFDGVIYSKGLIEVYNLSGQLLASDNETLNLSSIKGGQMVLIKTDTLIKYFIQ